MKAVKNAFRLYKENFKYILLISVSIVIPILLGYTFIVNYVTIPFMFFGIPLWPQLLQSFFMLIALFMMHPSFVSMVSQDNRFKEVKLGEVYADTLQYMFPVYIAGILYAFGVTVGMFFLVLPGIFLLLVFLAVPHTIVIDDLIWWKGIKQSFKFGINRFFPLLGIFLLFALVDTILSSLVLFASTLITKYLIVSNFALMIFNSLTIPLFIFTVGYIYLGWKEELRGTKGDYRIQRS